MLNRKQFLKLIGMNSAGIAILNSFPTSIIASPNFGFDIENNNTEDSNTLSPNLFDAVKSYKLIQSDNNNNLLVIAYELTDEIISSLPKERNVAIFCYKCSFKNGGSITLNGRNLFLLSKSIAFNNSTINTHYYTIQDANPIQKNGLEGKIKEQKNIIAPNGEDFAINGSGFKSADPINGKNGGDITIRCLEAKGNFDLIAKGGNGGKGQMGANGRDGDDNIDPNNISAPNHVGKIYGFPGEIGGQGALGGFGGDGGNVDILIPDIKLLKNLNLAGGEQGESGEAGNSGLNGSGIEHFFAGDIEVSGNKGNGSRIVHTYGNRNISSTGRNEPGKKNMNTGERKGKAGKITVNSGDFFKYIPLEYGKLLLLKAESLYLNSAYKENNENLNQAYELLSYIYKIASSNPGNGFSKVEPKIESNTTIDLGATISEEEKFILDNLFYLKEYKSDSKQWEAIKQKCSCYLNQIQLNLDFFGNPPNYAPNLAYDFLASNFRDNIPLVDGFEMFAKKITMQQNGLKKEIFQNTQYILQCKRNITYLNSEIENYKKLIISLNIELQQRFTTIENLKQILQNDQALLQKAIDDSGGCSFSMVLSCLTAIVAIAAAVVSCGAATVAAVAAVASVASALKTVNDFKELTQALNNEKTVLNQGVNNLSGKLKEVSNGIQTVRENVAEIKKAFNEKNVANHTIPDFLIAVDTSKFDTTIDKILDDPNLSDSAKEKAAKFKSDYHYFVDYVSVTNQKRIEITASVLQISNSYHERELQNQQFDRYSEINLTDNALLISDKLDLFDIYYKIKLQASYLIYLQNKSLLYQYPNQKNDFDGIYDQLELEYLKSDAFTANWYNIYRFNQTATSIQNPRNTLKPLVIEFSNNQGSNINQDTAKNYISYFSHQDFQTPLKDAKGNIYFSCHFNIVPTSANHNYIFLNSYNIKAMGVIAQLKSKKIEHDNLDFKLTHLGNSVITTDKEFNTMQFFQDSKTVSLFSKISSKRNSPPSFNSRLTDGTDPTSNLVERTLNQDFAQLGRSPFASWKIEISTVVNNLTEQQLKNIIADLSSIDLFFYYTYQQPQ